MTTQAKVIFMPSGRRGTFAAGTPILDAARELGVDLDTVCGGRQRCGRCQVEISEGHFSKLGVHSSGDHVSPFHVGEEKLVKMKRLKAGRRLGCTAQITGDLVIDVPPESQVHRQVVRKDASTRTLELDPLVRLYELEVAEPSLHDRGSNITRLEEALAREWGIEGITLSTQVLPLLHPALEKNKGQITTALRGDRELVGVWPGSVTEVYGFAIDIGTTTIAGHLCSLSSGEILASSGMMNPQIRFGEDLMSRVSYVQMNRDSLPDMVDVLRRAVAEVCENAMSEAGIEPGKVVEIVLVGNPIMHHFLHGFDPTPLGLSPFPLATDRGLSRPATELALPLAPAAMAYTLPCIAGHVGADAAGVALSEGPHRHEDVSLVIDIGTNAEILLGNQSRVLACSSPTGPAFEGAQISSGQRAAPGAIERFRIDPETLEPRYKVIGAELWSDDPEFEAATAATGVTGICGSGIIEAVVELYRAGIVSQEGLIQGEAAAHSPRIQKDGETYSYTVIDGAHPMRITQLDIRSIQLAKSAVYAGAKILMAKMGIEQVDRIVLAGAFGSYIDPLYAMALGMVPDCPADQISAAGNAAGTGAQMALLNRTNRAEIEALARKIDKVETAVEPTFQDLFVGAMGLPHRTDPFPNLEQVMTMPARTLTSDGGASGRRRRRARK